MQQNQWKRLMAIVLIVLIALLPVQALAEEKSTASAAKGVNYIERMGIGFALDKQMALRDGDLLQSCVGSQLELSCGDTKLTLNESALLKVDNAAFGSLALTLQEGELLADIGQDNSVTISLAGKAFVMRDALVLLSARSGSATVSVFYGSVASDADAALHAEAGQSLVLLDDTTESFELLPSSLNAFTLEQLLPLSDNRAMCFTKADLEAVLADRDEQKRIAFEEQAAYEAELRSRGGTEMVAVTTSGAAGITGPKCTIQIRCDTILNNMQDLTDGKNSYVPANGIILATSTIGFAEGETVFEVLKRACQSAGIQIEYSWTPMYGSYYIEGINHLYEFDCGSESGWMYKVNGWFPNYGCSSYTLKDGDTIVWCYTCKGLGADVGGSVY